MANSVIINLLSSLLSSLFIVPMAIASKYEVNLKCHHYFNILRNYKPAKWKYF
jgi:hypothetical protein